jgi:cytochrome P450
VPMTPDLEYFQQHYSLRDPHLADHMWQVVEHMRDRCPVAHSDARTDSGGAGRGMWVLTKYEDVLTVLQDWQTFSSDYRRLEEAETYSAGVGDTPPISTDPPRQSDFRRLLNPYLSPQAMAAHEPQVREIVTELIDDFIEDGHCDLAGQFAYLLPPRMLYRVLFGIESEDQLQRTLAYNKKMTEADNPIERAQAATAWMKWVDELIDMRRASPRRADVIDALLHGSVEGRPLTREEVSGAVRLLILGGFFTTNDAIGSAMTLLIDNPDLQVRLRQDPGLIPKIFDETLRLEPPVVSLFRVCTRDVELRGQQLKKGDAVLVHFGAANHDPDEFDNPDALLFGRTPNRHLAFGGGPHRCIGSNVARLNLRVVFEEILARLHDIRIAEGESPRYAPPNFSRGPEYLPISFTPGQRYGRNLARRDRSTSIEAAR